MHRSRSCRLLAVLPVLIATEGCAGGSGDVVETRSSAEWSVRPEPLVTIGRVDGDLDYTFARIAAVRLLPDGRIVVADGLSGTIRIYGSDGVFQRRMGGTGDGPGEFRYLTALSWAPPDTIVAYDSRALRLTKFLTTGELVSTQAFQASDGYPEVYIGTYSDGSHAFAWIKQMPLDRSRVTADVMQLGRFGREGRLSLVIDSAAGIRRLGSPVPFSGHLLTTMLGDTVFHTDGLAGVEAIASTGETLRTIDPPIVPWEFPEARRRLEETLDSAALRRISELEAVRGIDSIPSISDLLVDGEGRLWVKRYDPSTDSHWIGRRRTGGEWLVLESDGTVVARVSIPVGLRVLGVRGDRIAGIARDEFDVERVQVFALLRGEPAT